MKRGSEWPSSKQFDTKESSTELLSRWENFYFNVEGLEKFGEDEPYLTAFIARRAISSEDDLTDRGEELAHIYCKVAFFIYTRFPETGKRPISEDEIERFAQTLIENEDMYDIAASVMDYLAPNLNQAMIEISRSFEDFDENEMVFKAFMDTWHILFRNYNEN